MSGPMQWTAGGLVSTRWNARRASIEALTRVIFMALIPVDLLGRPKKQIGRLAP